MAKETDWTPVDVDTTSRDLIQLRADTVPAPPDDSLIGTLVDNKYLIEALLGEGGMGHVYRARHMRMGKMFAIKLIHAELAHVDEIAKRFKREARSSSLLNNPHCISVTDFGEFGEANNRQLFLAMELLEGEELDQRLSREKIISPKKVVAITIQILKGLGHAHEQGIVHRDLKPENIFLVSHDGNRDFVKILDFGIAKMADGGTDTDNLTKTGVVFGTPKYLSPEQALGDKIDHRSDLYAVGIILFEMLTGAPPFRAKTAMDTMAMHLTTPPPKLSEYGNFPKNLQNIVLKAMAKKPDERYEDAAAFIAALDAVDFGESSEITIVIPNIVDTRFLARIKKGFTKILKNLLIGTILFAIIAVTAGYFLSHLDDTEKKNLPAKIAKVEEPKTEPKTEEEKTVEEIQTLIEQATKSLEAGNIDAAEAAAKQALRIDTQSAAAKIMLGHVLFNSSKQIGAIYQYQRALDIDESYAQTPQMLEHLHEGLQWENIRKKAAAMLAKHGRAEDIAKLTELANSALTAGEVRRSIRNALEKADKANNIDWVSSLSADFHELKNCKDRNQIIAQMIKTQNPEFIPFLKQFRPKKRRGKKKSPNICLKTNIDLAIKTLSASSTKNSKEAPKK